MKPDSAKVALLGAGYIADYHLEALHRLPGTQVVAVCDLGRARAERLAGKHEGVTAYTDLARMLQDSRPDVVHVLTPPPAHFAPTLQILKAGVSALVEKPLALRGEDCAVLAAEAKARGLALGTGHNFLFAPPYERLMQDIAAGRLGRIDQVDVVWNKALPQVQSGPFGAWLFEDPRNILFEVAPHSFAHLVHLAGKPDRVEVEARDPVTLPGDRVFYRRWELRGQAGRVPVHISFAFGEGYTEHYLRVRGASGSATVDFELNTYVSREPSQDLPDFDRFAVAVRGARDLLVQAAGTLGSFVLSKAGLPFEGGPYAAGISRAVRSYYETRGGALDARLAPALASDVVGVAEMAARAARLLPPAAGAAKKTASPRKLEAKGSPTPATAAAKKGKVLVLGATGFIGRALVRQLLDAGWDTRALVRDVHGHAEVLAGHGAEIVRGDVTDTASVEAALDGVQHVYHLARGYGRFWDDYLRLDVEPTMRLAELCARRELGLYYTSSIVIYNAGRAGETITEATPPSAGAMRVSPYARAKVQSEQMLLGLQETRGLKVVIFRPGIVIGSGGSPYHWGVGAWPHNSICHLWGAGTDPLAFVLVEDCADAMVRALGTPGLVGESFNLVGPPCLTGQQYLDELERLAGIKVKRLPVPPWQLFAQDIAKWGLKTVAKAPGRSRPSLEYYVGLSGRAQFSPGKAQRVLGWSPTEDRARVIHEGIAVPVAEFLG